VKRAVYSLNNTAPGYDEVPPKIWEYGGNGLLDVFTCKGLPSQRQRRSFPKAGMEVESSRPIAHTHIPGFWICWPCCGLNDSLLSIVYTKHITLNQVFMGII